jgi:hypothetical protein
MPDSVDSGINDVRWEEAVGIKSRGASLKEAQATAD